MDYIKNEEQNNLKKKIESLKMELKEKQKSLTMIEYNKKQAIFEYLKKLDNNEKGMVKASIEAVELVFIKSALYRARTIRY